MSEREHKSAAELERDIRRTEDEIARTLDLIQQKVSPGAAVDAVVRMSRENGAEFAANLGRSVRDNPIPIALVGTGLAWLMLSGRGKEDDDRATIAYSSSRGSDDWRREREDANRIYPEGVYTTTVEGGTAYSDTDERTATSTASAGAQDDLYEEATSPTSGAAAAARHAEEKAREAAHIAQERARSMGDRAGGSARDAASAAGEAYSTARSKAEDMMSDVQSRAESAYGSTRAAGERVYSSARSASERAYSSARAAGEHASERLHAGGEAAYRQGSEVARRTASRAAGAISSLGSSLREHPLIAGAILASVGALVGALLPPTRREDALIGEHSDAVKSKAAETAEHEAERVRNVAAAAAEAARREAEARGLTPDSAIETAKEGIRKVVEAGGEVARTAIREGEAAAKGEHRQDGEQGQEDKGNEDESDETRNRPESSGSDIYSAGTEGAPVVPSPAVPPVATHRKPGIPEASAASTDPLNQDK